MYLYECLYRGQADGTGTFHIVLAETNTNALTGEKTTDISNALTPAQAAGMGFPVPVILQLMNAGLVNANAALRQELETTQAELSAALDVAESDAADAKGFFSRMKSAIGL